MIIETESRPFPFYGYAPGNYMNACTCCANVVYNVDKYCFVCLECAIKASTQRTKELAEALEKIRECHSVGGYNHSFHKLKNIAREALSNYQNK